MDVIKTNGTFVPQETVDNPFDVTLVVQDGKEFRAHRQVLSEASPFFEKLLNSDMRESKEGVVRLGMLTGSVLGDILEIIYTGTLQCFAEENARDLIAMADYFFLPRLQTFAVEVLIQKLTTLNCIATYYFAERYRCEELVTHTKKFILKHFTTLAKTEEFLNMSSKEVEEWISSDEIDVSAEEDVFSIILSWVNHIKRERKKYFAELFRHVRLVYVLRDNLVSDFVTNELVKQSQCCLDLVNEAVNLIDSQKNLCKLSVTPRRSLETPVIIACTGKHVLCHFPREDTWCRLRDTLPQVQTYIFHSLQVASCRGKILFVVKQGDRPSSLSFITYDSLCNCWTSIPYKDNRYFHKIFARNDDEIYALLSDNQLPGQGDHIPYITKYKPESNLWENISSLPSERRHVEGICIVANDNFICFLGGGTMPGSDIALSDADRYDLSKNKWDKIADMQEARKWACGATAHGQIFIAGGVNLQCHFSNMMSKSCEVYSETTNKWQYIASLRVPRYGPTNMMCVDDKLYVLGGLWSTEHHQTGKPVECYDPVNNEWIEHTKMPVKLLSTLPGRSATLLNSCSLRVFKRSKFLGNAMWADKDERRKCPIM